MTNSSSETRVMQRRLVPVKPQEESSTARTRFGFAITVLFLVLEYARPQDKIPVFGASRLSLVVAFLMIASWFFSTNLSFAKSKQTTCMLLLAALLASFIPFARNNFLAYSYTKGFLMLFPFYISIILYVTTLKRLKIFINVWTGLMVYLAVNGITGKGLGGSSFLSDENDFSLLMNMMLPFSVFLAMYERALGRKLLLIAASILAAVSVVVSFSRGGFVGLVVVCAIVYFFSPRKIISLVLVVILATSVYFFADQKYWNEMATIQDTEESTSRGRIESWKAAWAMFKDNPLGVGGGNFPIRFPEYQPSTMKRNMWGVVAHSLWFTLLPELGIVGVAIYGLLFSANIRTIMWLKSLKKETDDLLFTYFLSLAFLGSFAGYFSSGTFLSVLYYPHYFYITAMIVATQKIVEEKLRSRNAC